MVIYKLIYGFVYTKVYYKKNYFFAHFQFKMNTEVLSMESINEESSMRFREDKDILFVLANARNVLKAFYGRML